LAITVLQQIRVGLVFSRFALRIARSTASTSWPSTAEIVTMVIREEKIGERVKYWVRPDIENRIQEGSIKAYFNSTVKAIREAEVDIITPEGMITLANDWVLAMTGYQPDLPFLQSIGVTLSSDAILKPQYSEDTHESNISNLYLAGVICGGMNTHRLFIENSREHAEKIIATIAERVFKT
jgi:thioredoxin reductase (NADPH)